jgi:ferredoxin
VSDRFLRREDLQRLLEALQNAGYRCVGPQVRDGTVVFDVLTRASQLPVGWRDRQAPGSYRIEPSAGPRAFAWANGPQALKPLTFASREVMWRVDRGPRGELHFAETLPEVAPTAVIGVRGCDLAALHLQDQHFGYREYADHYYNRRRRALLLVGVDCAYPAATCFCHSTGDGPGVSSGFDIALTELEEGFLVRARGERGQAIVAGLPLAPASPGQLECAAAQAQAAAQGQARQLPARDLRDALLERLDHARWGQVAARCLSCGNCTSVCPTCFCHSEGDYSAMDGRHAEHHRQWDSCFTEGHSYIHGLVVRDSTRLRYRQWLVHKLGLWHDQYGRSGCVGCGRCITWCPVGIDITDEVAALVGETSRA